MIRIGCGAGFAGDRFDPAEAVLGERVDYLVFECLAERTIAHRQAERGGDGSRGYDPYLPRRVGAVLRRAVTQGTGIITNAGAANPLAGGRAVASLAEREGLRVTVAVVTGDDVLDLVDIDAPALEDGVPLRSHGEIVSANAYIGVDAVLPALATGADVVVTGRVADPSLFAAPVLHGLGWSPHNASEMATATVAGHLLECGAQVTGGYFADPGRKDVAGLDRLGFPIAEVTRAGSTVVTKPAGTGGVVDARTVKEQLLYEVLDPAAYVTPDGSIDLTTASVEVLGPGRVEVAVGPAGPRPDRLKVNVGYRAGHRAEAGISYAGPQAAERARMAGEVVAERLRGRVDSIRIDLVGIDALHGAAPESARHPYECRLRVAARDSSRERAESVCEEITALYTNGPAGGGGVRVQCEEIIGVVSTMVPRGSVRTSVTTIRTGDHEAV